MIETAVAQNIQDLLRASGADADPILAARFWRGPVHLRKFRDRHGHQPAHLLAPALAPARIAARCGISATGRYAAGGRGRRNAPSSPTAGAKTLAAALANEPRAHQDGARDRGRSLLRAQRPLVPVDRRGPAHHRAAHPRAAVSRHARRRSDAARARASARLSSRRVWRRAKSTPTTSPRRLAALSTTIDALLAGRPATFSWDELMTGEAPHAERAPPLHQRQADPRFRCASSRARRRPRRSARRPSELGLTPDKGVRVRLTGPVAMADDEFGTVADGALLNVILTVAAVLLILWFALRSGRHHVRGHVVV